MRQVIIKWTAGLGAFVLPALVALIGNKLDHSGWRNDATYKALIPFFAWGSLALAVGVPAVLLLTSGIRRWLAVTCALGIWGLLAVELYWLFFAVIMAH